jgi:hypothetical protein
MVRSIDPQREILRHAQWPFSPRSPSCLELVLRKTILASVRMRCMDASDPIVTNLQKILQAGAVHIWAWKPDRGGEAGDVLRAHLRRRRAVWRTGQQDHRATHRATGCAFST